MLWIKVVRSNGTIEWIIMRSVQCDNLVILLFMLRLVRSFSTAKDTCLKQVHLDHKGKLVDFAGYNLPVYYGKGIIKEHLHCRTAASIFDVSHMGQLVITGPDRLRLLQRTTVGSTVRKSKPGITECYLTMFLNERAGIIDDAIATNLEAEETVRIVVNGANKYIVLEHLKQVIANEHFKVDIRLLEENGLIALQGPKSAEVLQGLVSGINLAEVPFMSQFNAKFDGVNYTITRSGYTGEDGFEIAASGPSVVNITQALLKNPAVELAGLGSRDSLRLEAGLCLHGHDINPTTTPLEGALTWTVFKRKANDSRVKFIGEQALAELSEQVKNKSRSIRKRVGFVVTEPGVIREHCKVFTKEGKEVGETTSGSPSPSLKKSIGMAYVDQAVSADETELVAEQRGKRVAIRLSKMPFVPSNYYKRWGTV